MPRALRPSTVSSSSLSVQRASQTVEPGDAQAVTGSSVVDELGEPGTIRALSGGDVGEDTNRAGFKQAVSLGVEALVGSRDARVPEPSLLRHVSPLG